MSRGKPRPSCVEWMKAKTTDWTLSWLHGLRGGELAAIARRDQPVEVALDDGLLHLVIGGDEALGRGRLVVGPLGDVGADAERALHGAEHTVGERGGAAC